MMAPPHVFSGLGLAKEKLSQEDTLGGTLDLHFVIPGLVFVLRLMPDSLRKSNKSHI